MVFAALTIWATIRNQDGYIVRVLEWPALQYLGRISYAFYLWHYPIDLRFLEPYLQAGLPFGSWTLIVLAEYASTFLVATASWWLVEAPMLRLRDRIVSREPALVTLQPLASGRSSALERTRQVFEQAKSTGPVES